MRSFTLLATLATVVSHVVAPNPATFNNAPYPSLRVFESLRRLPQGWTKQDAPSPSARLRLRIALQEPDHEFFEKTLFAVSDPYHQKYGQHLKRHEVKALIKPRDESTEAVLSWLRRSGVAAADIENNGEWINFVAPVATAEKMLDTTFSYYTQNGDKSHTKKIRTLHYSVPADVSNHITMVQPTTRFGKMMAEKSNVFIVAPALEEPTPPADLVPGLTIDPSCNTVITPACLRALYNVGDYQADPHVGTLLGVNGFLEQYAKYDNFEEFKRIYAPYAKRQTFDFVKINGGLDTQNDSSIDDVEANLDIQYAAALGYKQKIKFYSTGGRGPLVPDLDQPDPNESSNEPYLDFLNYITALPDRDLPQTLTTSYGEDEQSVPEPYVRKVCKMFGELGMRGVSVIFSSGDTGVASACQTNDGKNATRFLPIFPAACPYVTSVGATYKIPERAIAFSSGGFSDIFPRPSYQDAAVTQFLGILGNRWDGLYNSTGRGFPDIAAQGYNYSVIEEVIGRNGSYTGEFTTALVGGTSASAPTIAGIISLLNNARVKAKQKPLGFLNPWLYSIGKDGLNDVALGGSTGCDGRDDYSGLPTPFVPYASWNATAGWDPVTGLGTPNFAKLLALSTPGNSTGNGTKLPHIQGCVAGEYC